MSFIRWRVWRLVFSLIGLITVVAAACNLWVVYGTKPHIKTVEQATKSEPADAILILGAKVTPTGELSLVLYDRMVRGIELYKAGIAPKLLLSGDHGREDYDEVNAMKAFAIDQGVPKEDIFTDYAGFSTYESVYRAKDVFCVKSLVIVTQDFHISRAVYIARAMGVEAYGVQAPPRDYPGYFWNQLREIPGRVKDLVCAHLRWPKPALGNPYDIHGDGSLSHD